MRLVDAVEGLVDYPEEVKMQATASGQRRFKFAEQRSAQQL